MELSRFCNYNCIYCYTEASNKAIYNELNYEEIKKIINTCVKLGVESVVFIGGGEPLLYPRIFDLISFVYSKGVTSILFSNGSVLGDDKLSKNIFKKDCRYLINFLSQHDTSIILKADTFNSSLYDKITGKKGSYQVFKKFLLNVLNEYQKDKNYSRELLRIGLATVLLKYNKKEIIKIWKFCRNNNLFPHFEPVGYEGRAKNFFKNISLTKREAVLLYKKLSKIDKEKYNIEWDYNIALPAYNCQQLRYSIYITSDGTVQPCNGISIKCGNIRNSNIKKILNHPILKKTRNIYHYINEDCRHCVKFGKCYGCQGRAYNIGDGLFEKDPFCTKI